MVDPIALTRELVALETPTGARGPRRGLPRGPAGPAGVSGRPAAGDAGPRQPLRLAGGPGGGVLHPPRLRPALRAAPGGRDPPARPRHLRRQGARGRDGRRRRTARRGGRAPGGAAVRGGRGERLRWRPDGQRAGSRGPVPDQRRADGEPAEHGAEGLAQDRARVRGPSRAFGVSRRGALSDRSPFSIPSSGCAACRCPTDPMLGPGTLNVGVVQGGVAPNVIPAVRQGGAPHAPGGAIRGPEEADRRPCAEPGSPSTFPTELPYFKNTGPGTGGLGHHGGQLRQRPALLQRLGGGVPARSRHDPRSAHQRGTDRQGRAARGVRLVRQAGDRPDARSRHRSPDA